jgi:phosphatidate cytidylyltransferase
MSYMMAQYPYLVCPIEYSESLGRMTMDCEPSLLFRLQEYTLPHFLLPITKVVSGKITSSVCW